MQRLFFTIFASLVAFILVGCQQPKKGDSSSNTEPILDSDNILLREKVSAQDKVEEKRSSIRDEFLASAKKQGGANNEISRDDCEAITTKTVFRYSSLDESDTLVYLIDEKLIPIIHLESGKCTVLAPILLQKEATDFVYSSDGKPLIKKESVWALEKIEGCDKDFEYIPGCNTLVKYTKELFVDDESMSSGDIKRHEFSVHHRQPSKSWLEGECQLVQGGAQFNCTGRYSLSQLKKYRKYIVNNSGESFAVYLSNQEVVLD